jgi:hypothetical protein
MYFRDTMKNLDLLKVGMSLAETGWCYGRNESSICSPVLNSMHPEHYWVVLKGVPLRNIGHRFQDTKKSSLI